MQTRTSRNAGKLRHMIIVAFFLFFKEYILIHVSDHKGYHRNENEVAESEEDEKQ